MVYYLQEDKENTEMSKKENTTGTTMATEIIRVMERLEERIEKQHF